MAVRAHVLRARDRVRSAFYRHRSVRRALFALLWPRLRRNTYELTHMPFYREFDAGGALQRDEALLLFGLVRVLRPKVVLEIGFLMGQSAFNFLQALDDDAQLHSIDVTELSERVAREGFADDPRFSFHRVSQADIGPEVVGHAPVDLVFLDAAHDLDLNVETFRRLDRMLAPDAVVAVHDTGTWARPFVDEIPVLRRHAAIYSDGWISDDEYEHQHDERVFVNWILQEHAEFSVVNLHTLNTPRHGMTLLQRRRLLPVAGGETTAEVAAGTLG